MADHNEKKTYKYLLDVTNSRQYALYDEGKTSADDECRVFGGDVKPSEDVFAISEDYEVDGSKIYTTFYQLAFDEKGQYKTRLELDVAYDIKPAQTHDGRIVVVYELDRDSAEALKANNASEKAPLRIVRAVSADLQQRIIYKMATAQEIAALVPLPQHPKGADKVRAALGDSNTPKENFNKAVTPSKPKNYKVGEQHLWNVLNTYGTNLTQAAKDGELDPVVGRDDEVDQAMKIMTRRKQASVCFTGEAGVGKSAMFSAIAQRMASDESLPDSLANGMVFLLDLQKMNAGAKFRGEFEEKLKPLIDGLQERDGMINNRKVFIAIDEIHSQLTAGMAQGGMDAGQMMKTFMASKGISVIGTTTDDEYTKHIEADPALASRFEKLQLKEPSKEAVAQIIKRLWPLTKAHNHIVKDLTDDQVEYIITMTTRYAPQEAQPRKSEKVMNMAAASAEFAGRKEITRDDIVAAVAQMSGLDINFLNQSDYERFLEMEQELPEMVLGQKSIHKVTEGLIGARSGLAEPGKPWGCFVFQGPTGTGKTELAKALARYMFGSEDAMIKFDMSEFSEKHTVSRLIGAPAGYVGYDDSKGTLTEQVRRRPYSIILLDEIEKAHPDVFNILLPILNDGKTKDNKGKTVLFNNTIIIMTTNAGAQEVMNTLEGKSGIHFGTRQEMSPDELEEKLSRVYKRALTEDRGDGRGPVFRPEMINRINELGGPITFVPLTEGVIRHLAARELEGINKRLSDAAGANLPGVRFVLGDALVDQIAKEGYEQTMGARPLKKAIRQRVVNPAGKWIMNPENRRAIEEAVVKAGAAKVVINSFEEFKPEVVEDPQQLVSLPDAVVNDNAPATAPKRKPRANKSPAP